MEILEYKYLEYLVTFHQCQLLTQMNGEMTSQSKSHIKNLGTKVTIQTHAFTYNFADL